MLEIALEHVEYRYPSQTDTILKDTHFTISSSSKIVIIGNNGCGKSTLFALLQGKIAPIAGQIKGSADLDIAYLPQNLDFRVTQTLEDYLWQGEPLLAQLKRRITKLNDDSTATEMAVYDEFYHVGGYSFAAKINSVLPLFQFTEADLQRHTSELSGGECTKLALCALLLKEPDLILLDEPTNHLDTETLIWLEHYLLNLNIPYILISHDRSFLDHCITKIVELDEGITTIYNCNYTFYQQHKELHYQQAVLALRPMESCKRRRVVRDSARFFNQPAGMLKNLYVRVESLENAVRSYPEVTELRLTRTVAAN